MQRIQTHFEKTLHRYAHIYKLIGVIELTLRERIPVTLSSNRETKAPWFQEFLFDLPRKRIIEIAISRNGGMVKGVENYIPLSFWARMYFAHGYKQLWKKKLHKTMPNFLQTSSLTQPAHIARLMRELVVIRNRVAHYEPSSANRYKKDKEVLRTIMSALGVKAD